ncbi:MAG: AMP-binding protein [Candidatus Firestonebacteria bacterium]
MKTLQQMVGHMKSYGGSTAVSWKGAATTVRLSYLEAHDMILTYSKGLLELGLTPGDRVAIISRNIPEWITLTLGINCAGLIDVPRGENTEPEEIAYILEHSRAKLVIAEDAEIVAKINRKSHKELQYIITIKKVKGEKHISELEKLGKRSRKKIKELKPEDTASIIYTSGSTGAPKGVELTHLNFASNVVACADRIKITPKDKFISILPAWHAFERIVKYIALLRGAETFYSSTKTLLADFAEQEPSVMASVPRVWENIYSGVMKKIGEQGKVKKIIFDAGVGLIVGCKKKTPFHPAKALCSVVHPYLDEKVFKGIRAKLGKNFRFGVSGGSKLPAYIDDFFNIAAGIELLEGYGLTETSPVLSVRQTGQPSPYTVGPLLDNIKGKILDPETGRQLSPGEEGVICVKGPSIMKGYYRNFEETKKVIWEEGWFDTGDRGYFDKQGNLVITGREKDIVVLSNGENVNPLAMEECLTKSKYIETAVVTGHDWRHLGALIVPSFEELRSWCAENRIKFNPDRILEVLENTRVIELYSKEIKKHVNQRSGFKDYELIRDFRFISQSFEVGKELTATLKLKRRIIEEMYADHLDSMSDSIHGRNI